MVSLVKVPVNTGFRRLLYLVSPNETSFRTLDEVPDFVTEAILFFLAMVLIETIVLVCQGKQTPRINDGVNSVACGLVSLLHSLLFRGTELAGFMWMYNRYNIVTLPWDNPMTWVLCLLGVDLGYYFAHRYGHEMNIMWAGHQTHHSSEDYNLTTALRQSAVHRYTVWVFYLPLALVMPPAIFQVHIQFNLLYQFWIHTEVIKSLGPLEWILSTPSHHRVHHGRNPYCIDKNYGGTFIIWDRLFGTFAAEREDEKVVYGLVHPLNSWDPSFAQFGHLQYMWKTFKQMDGLSNKLSVIWKGPGWGPGKPRLGLPEDIPQVKAPITKYDSGLPMWGNLYVIVHFGVVMIGYTDLTQQSKVIPAIYTVYCILYIMLSLTAFGALHDHKNYGPLLEFGRCLLFLLVQQVLPVPLLLFSQILQWLYIASACFWGYMCIQQYSVSVKTKAS
ncbi:hypothetical protein ScPMuIL_012120 [Solemya velum]